MGNVLGRTALYRIMRVAERFPDIEKAADYFEKFMALEPDVQANFLAYCRIREEEDALLASARF